VRVSNFAWRGALREALRSSIRCFFRARNSAGSVLYTVSRIYRLVWPGIGEWRYGQRVIRTIYETCEVMLFEFFF